MLLLNQCKDRGVYYSNETSEFDTTCFINGVLEEFQSFIGKKNPKLKVENVFRNNLDIILQSYSNSIISRDNQVYPALLKDTLRYYVKYEDQEFIPIAASCDYVFFDRSIFRGGARVFEYELNYVSITMPYQVRDNEWFIILANCNGSLCGALYGISVRMENCKVKYNWVFDAGAM